MVPERGDTTEHGRLKMALQSISKAMREKAEALAAISDKWALGVRNSDGLRFVLFASCSRPDIFYMTRIDGAPGCCTCPAARLGKRANCFHLLACQIVTDRVREQAARPRPTYDGLMDRHLVDAF
jgi:hypothetical protein